MKILLDDFVSVWLNSMLMSQKSSHDKKREEFLAEVSEDEQEMAGMVFDTMTAGRQSMLEELITLVEKQRTLSSGAKLLKADSLPIDQSAPDPLDELRKHGFSEEKMKQEIIEAIGEDDPELKAKLEQAAESLQAQIERREQGEQHWSFGSM